MAERAAAQRRRRRGVRMVGGEVPALQVDDVVPDEVAAVEAPRRGFHRYGTCPNPSAWTLCIAGSAAIEAAIASPQPATKRLGHAWERA